jgi:hypothetical protein
MNTLPIRDDLNSEIVSDLSRIGWTYQKQSRVDIQIGKPRTFTKDNWTVWNCIHDNKVMWAKAKTVDNRYTEHSYHESLIQAIKF